MSRSNSCKWVALFQQRSRLPFNCDEMERHVFNVAVEICVCVVKQALTQLSGKGVRDRNWPKPKAHMLEVTSASYSTDWVDKSYVTCCEADLHRPPR